jgi:murein DD-endopeptidase MepM/ murein hydrolase activator NlpD
VSGVDLERVKSARLRADQHAMASWFARVRRPASAAAAIVAGAIWVGPLVAAQDAPAPARLDGPGRALVRAERVALRPPPVPEGKLIFPLDPGGDCYVNNDFGAPRSHGPHQGIDIMGSSGRAVYAVAAGTLVKRYANTGSAGWGWTLYDSTTNTTYKYFHLTEDANGLVEGSAVTRGAIIGFVGSSGTSSPTNFHLHFEVRPDNVAVDPLPLLVVDPKKCRISPSIR